MAISQSKLAQKRHAKKLKRKGKQYQAPRQWLQIKNPAEKLQDNDKIVL